MPRLYRAGPVGCVDEWAESSLGRSGSQRLKGGILSELGATCEVQYLV